MSDADAIIARLTSERDALAGWKAGALEQAARNRRELSEATAQRDAAVADLATLRNLIDVRRFDDGTYAVGISSVHWQTVCEILAAAPAQHGGAAGDDLPIKCECGHPISEHSVEAWGCGGAIPHCGECDEMESCLCERLYRPSAGPTPETAETRDNDAAHQLGR